MTVTEGILPRDEARHELLGMLTGGLGPIPSEMMVDHLLDAYADAPWPVLRDAGRALLRRADSVEREGLRIAVQAAAIGSGSRIPWTSSR